MGSRFYYVSRTYDLIQLVLVWLTYMLLQDPSYQLDVASIFGSYDPMIFDSR